MPRKRVNKNKKVTLPVLNPDAAGIDIGATEIYVAVPADRDAEPVRMFATFTQDLNELVDWLQQRPHSRDGIHRGLLDSTNADSGNSRTGGLSCERQARQECSGATHRRF
jgi:hypothetical protein